MFNVVCPECKKIRTVKAKKSWMVGNSPYEKTCKSCCQLGKEKSAECKQKLSAAIQKLQTEEVLNRKSQYMKNHPELWQPNLISGQGAGWNKGLDLPSKSDQTKSKISESMKKRKLNNESK